MMNRGRRPATIDLGLGTERQRGKFHRGGRAWKTSRSRMHASRRSGTVPRRRQRARTDRDAMARARVFAPSTRRRALCTLAARSHRTYWLCCATRRAFSLFPGEMHALLCARQGGRAHLALVRRRLSLAGRRSVPGRGNWPDRRTRGAGALLASYLPMPASPSRGGRVSLPVELARGQSSCPTDRCLIVSLLLSSSHSRLVDNRTYGVFPVAKCRLCYILCAYVHTSHA